MITLRDVLREGVLHEKLFAVHRAGQELSRLSEDELSRMSTAERIDLLKANILQYSQRILSFQNLEVRLLDPKTRKLNILLSEGMTAFDRSKELYAFETGNGVTGYVAATGRSYLCNNVKSDKRYLPGVREAQSSLTVPLIFADEVVGTFNVESTSPAHFSPADQQFLEIFGREIAAAIHTLELLQAEKHIAGTASLEEIFAEVGLPADEIQSDASNLLDMIKNNHIDLAQFRVLIRKMFEQARKIKASVSEAHLKLDTPTKGANEPNRNLVGKRVLLADSEVATRRSAHSLLQKLGLEVDTVKSGGEAVRQVAQANYDIIMGDIRLPDMNGYEFFKAMQQAAPGTPLVLVTGFGYDAQHSMVKARSEGQELFLFKPFRIDRLRESLESALKLPTKATFTSMVSARTDVVT
jgi:CheY-like chemotaxis protein